MSILTVRDFQAAIARQFIANLEATHRGLNAKDVPRENKIAVARVTAEHLANELDIQGGFDAIFEFLVITINATDDSFR